MKAIATGGDHTCAVTGLGSPDGVLLCVCRCPLCAGRRSAVYVSSEYCALAALALGAADHDNILALELGLIRHQGMQLRQGAAFDLFKHLGQVVG